MKLSLSLIVTAAAAGILTGTYAGSPGGVPGAVTWLRAEADTAAGGYVWVDLSGDRLRAEGERQRHPDSILYMNFHPVLDLGHGTVTETFSPAVVPLAQFTVTGVFGKTGLPHPSPSTSDTLLTVTTSAGRTAAICDTVTLPHVLSVLRAGAPIRGTLRAGTLSLGGHGTDRRHTAHSPEIILYNRLLTPGERIRVESYLSLRHGITLPRSLVASDGRLLWDMDGTFCNNRVCGIGRDDSTRFLQEISMPVGMETAEGWDSISWADPVTRLEADSLHFLTIGRTPLHEMPDGSYTLWGDDDGATAAEQLLYEEGDAGMWQLCDRTVRADNTRGASDRHFEAEILHPMLDAGSGGRFLDTHTVPVLLFDLSGTAAFDTSEKEYLLTLPCGDIDPDRRKLIFRHLPLDGEVHFRAGAYRGFRAEVTPRCGAGAVIIGKNGLPGTDTEPEEGGSVDVSVTLGTPPYRYSLLVGDNGTHAWGDTLASGISYKNGFSIEKIPEGHYELAVTQGGGMSLCGMSGTVCRSRVYGDRIRMNWTVGSRRTDYRVSLVSRETGERVCADINEILGTGFIPDPNPGIFPYGTLSTVPPAIETGTVTDQTGYTYETVTGPALELRLEENAASLALTKKDGSRSTHLLGNIHGECSVEIEFDKGSRIHGLYLEMPGCPDMPDLWDTSVAAAEKTDAIWVRNPDTGPTGEVYIALADGFTRYYDVIMSDCLTLSDPEVIEKPRPDIHEWSGDPIFAAGRATEGRYGIRDSRKGIGDTAAGAGLSGLPEPEFSVRREGGNRYTATLRLERDSDATLMVFDSAGLLLTEIRMNGGGEGAERGERSASFTLPSDGVYTVKAITDTGEYTARIAV